MNSSNITETSPFLFERKNYILMGVGLLLIVVGFYTMTGYDANTRPDGSYDPTYWNVDIFSWTRIHLSSILITCGFIVEVLAILYPFKNK